MTVSMSQYGSSCMSPERLQVALGALVVAAAALVARPAAALTFTFQDIINTADPTFNQELGINNSGMIAGYFGSGAAGHPNQGYTTIPPYTSFTPENFPGSVQTQVTGLNNMGTTVGFWSNSNNGVGLDSNFGFTDVGGTFTNVNIQTLRSHRRFSTSFSESTTATSRSVSIPTPAVLLTGIRTTSRAKPSPLT